MYSFKECLYYYVLFKKKYLNKINSTIQYIIGRLS